MDNQRTHLIVVTEEELLEIPKHISMRSKFIDNSYYPEDAAFMKLYKANKKARRELDEYKFNKRHK